MSHQRFDLRVELFYLPFILKSKRKVDSSKYIFVGLFTNFIFKFPKTQIIIFSENNFVDCKFVDLYAVLR